MRPEVRITKILFPACWVTHITAQDFPLYPNYLSARFPLIEPNRLVVVVASYPLEVPPFLPPVPLGSPHTPDAINSCLISPVTERKERTGASCYSQISANPIQFLTCPCVARNQWEGGRLLRGRAE